jgi:hypothetical protein
MSITAVVPEKHSATPTKLKTFFRVILAIFVSVGAIDQEKRRLTCIAKVPACRVCEMLSDTARAWMSVKLSADNSTGNKINVLLRKIPFWIVLDREALR